MASLRSDVASLVACLAGDHGCEVRMTTSGHWRVTRPGYGSVSMSSTPSDKRSLRNAKADARRYLGITI